ncbi:hypothetical protein PPERSA_09860 [Pseudocohnilembus persalinus]|uniref:Protein phosphatase inhibitor 2 (IPP-2) n=1 Tax=Pseudocohnilembus persalinus TaxID=266149 RepID=A0A0V0QUT4_PSEPJ|nr:hypothetical protein PPERSA_09860 [Pseudocohnilembus persalinus]|eukprot:KRX05720.1 hypothetical protein PPERSA_09860 [Pseudocohnilembus persalinus]
MSTLQKPKKGILKKSNTIEMKDNEEQAKKNNQQPHLHWDEEAIEEYDKTRGQTMRVDEPKTPYEEAIDDSEEEEHSQQNSHHQHEEKKFELDTHQVQKQLEIARQNQQLNQQVINLTLYFYNLEQNLQYIQKSQKLDINELNRRLNKELDNQDKQLLLDSDEERDYERKKQAKKQLKMEMEKEEEDEDDEEDENNNQQK